MKTTLTRRGRGAGFTLLEVLFVVLIIGILAMLLLPVIEKGRSRSKQVSCGSGLRQVGIAFHMFAHDHQNEFPFQVSVAAGGTKEFLESGLSLGSDFYFAYRHFQPLSNDLSDPRLLVCPSDTQRSPAANFVDLRNQNISYALGVSAVYQQPDSVLAGDRNILLDGNPLGAVALIVEHANLGWNSLMHGSRGNLLFADGRVQGLAAPGLTTALASRTGSRLVSPLVPALSELPRQGSGGGGGSGGASDGSSGSSASPGSSSSASAAGGSSGFGLLQQAFSTDLGGPSAGASAPASGRASSSASGSPVPAAVAAPTAPATAASAVDAGSPGVEPEPEPVANAQKRPSQDPSISAPVDDRAPGVDKPGIPAQFGTMMARPETCWLCWLLMLLGAIGGLVGLAYLIRFRNIRLRRSRALAP